MADDEKTIEEQVEGHLAEDTGKPGDTQIPDVTKMDHSHMEKHTIKVDGKEIELSLDQLIERAQKGTAAEKRMSEAAELRKTMEEKGEEYEDLVRMRGLFNRMVMEADQNAYTQLLTEYAGIPPEVVAEVGGTFFNNELTGYEDEEDVEYEEDDDDTEDIRMTQNQNKGQEPPRKTGYQDLEPEVQDALRHVESQRQEKILTDLLDNHKKMSYHMQRQSEKGREAIKTAVRKQIARRLTSENLSFEAGAPAVVEEFAEFLEVAGTPERPTPHHTGLGPAPGGRAEDQVYPKEKPEDVPFGDASHDDGIHETLQWAMAQQDLESKL